MKRDFRANNHLVAEVVCLSFSALNSLYKTKKKDRCNKSSGLRNLKLSLATISAGDELHLQDLASSDQEGQL